MRMCDISDCLEDCSRSAIRRRHCQTGSVYVEGTSDMKVFLRWCSSDAAVIDSIDFDFVSLPAGMQSTFES